MCAILLLAGVLVMAIVTFVVFVKSAIVLLPWSLPAAAFSTLAGVLIGKLVLRSKKPQSALPIALGASFLLTLTLGYAGCTLAPPMVPQAPPSRNNLREVLEMPRPSQETLEDHLPTHLTIAALMSAAAVAILWRSVAKRDDFGSGERDPDA